MRKAILAALFVAGFAPAAMAEPVALDEAQLDQVSGGWINIVVPINVQTNVGVVTTPTIATANVIALAGSVFGNANSGGSANIFNIVSAILGQNNSNN